MERTNRLFEYKDHWLVRRPDTDKLSIAWLPRDRSGRPARRILRRSTGTADLAEARSRLIEFVEGAPSIPTPALSQPSPQPTAPVPIGLHRTPITVSHSASVGRVPLMPVLEAYVNRLADRPSHPVSLHARNAWAEFCRLERITFVDELTLPVQERFLAWRRRNRVTGEPVSNGTLNRMLETLRAAFFDAWRRGELASFPAIRMLPKPPPRDRFLTAEEVQRLLKACDEPYLYRFTVLALHTLQRPSAILSLRTEQVDLVWNRINFLGQGRTQTNKRRATVPITSTLKPILEQAIAESVTGYLIECYGDPVRRIRRSFRTAGTKAGIPNLTPGILRHTGATLLAAAGVPIREISGMLGHTTSRITEEVYAKRRPEFLAEAARTLDRIFPVEPAGSLTTEPFTIT